MPALLTRIDTGPNSLPIASINASTAAPSVTSSTRPAPPIADSRCVIVCAPASVVAVPITFAPWAARTWAIAAPIPRLAPVTRAISPWSTALIRCSLFSARGFGCRRPDQRLRDDCGLAVERQRRRAMQFIAQRERRADAAAERVVVGPGQHSIGGKIVRGGTHAKLSLPARPVGDRLRQFRRRTDRAPIDRPLDALEQSDQHLAGSALGRARHAARREFVHACRPAHGHVQL